MDEGGLAFLLMHTRLKVPQRESLVGREAAVTGDDAPDTVRIRGEMYKELDRGCASNKVWTREVSDDQHR